jgi:hypothetical protein
VLAKHSEHFSLVDVLSIGIDRIQRNFEPMKKQVEAWKATRISDESAKLVIYRAFVQGDLDVPRHLARRVRDLYFIQRSSNLLGERLGASPTHSQALSRNSTPFLSSGRLRSLRLSLNRQPLIRTNRIEKCDPRSPQQRK